MFQFLIGNSSTPKNGKRNIDRRNVQFQFLIGNSSTFFRVKRRSGMIDIEERFNSL